MLFASILCYRTAGAEGTIKIPGAAGGSSTADGKVSGNAGIGFEYSVLTGYLRIRLDLGIAGFTLHNEQKRDYANMVLLPDTRGATVAADGAYFWSGKNNNIHIGIGGSFRSSPSVTWSYDEILPDATTNTTKTINHSSTVSTAALLLGGAFLWNLPTGKEIPVDIGLNLGFSLRGILGDIVHDQFLMTETLGTTSTVFIGGEARLKVRVRDVNTFVSMPFLYSANGTGGDVQGLSGVRILVGLEVNGSLFTKEIGSTEINRAFAPQRLPLERRETPRFDL